MVPIAPSMTRTRSRRTALSSSVASGRHSFSCWAFHCWPVSGVTVLSVTQFPPCANPPLVNFPSLSDFGTASTVAPMLWAAVLWDLDGTLIDTEPVWMAGGRAIASAHGDEWTDADGLAQVG